MIRNQIFTIYVKNLRNYTFIIYLVKEYLSYNKNRRIRFDIKEGKHMKATRNYLANAQSSLQSSPEGSVPRMAAALPRRMAMPIYSNSLLNWIKFNNWGIESNVYYSRLSLSTNYIIQATNTRAFLYSINTRFIFSLSQFVQHRYLAFHDFTITCMYNEQSE